MKKLLSLPPNLVRAFHAVEGLPASDYFCTSDPVGHKLGSGGGTAWLLWQAWQHASSHPSSSEPSSSEPSSSGPSSQQATPSSSLPSQPFSSPAFNKWLSAERRVLIHAGGQSRRLPAYAPSGKVLAPIDADGRNLLSEGLPFCEALMQTAPASIHTLVLSGDVLISSPLPAQPMPQADVVCYALPAAPEQLSHHGVYALSAADGLTLDFMLQKPSVTEQQQYTSTHTLLLDIGLWALSDRAVQVLCRRSCQADGSIGFYDLYGQFGTALGRHPHTPDAEVSALSVAIVPLPEGRFLHFGTTPELITSVATLTGQPNPDAIWVENSVTEGWTMPGRNVVTGVPRLSAPLALRAGQCVDVVPVGAEAYALRPYGYADAFRGAPTDPATLFMGQPLGQWLEAHHVTQPDILGAADIQEAPLFPVVGLEDAGPLLAWMLAPSADACHPLYANAERLSADQLMERANLPRLYSQRLALREARLDEPRAFARLRAQITEPLLVGHEVCPQIDDQYAEVRATAPLRMDVSGGWTDTPPFCIQHGGAVVNVSLLLNGNAPLSCFVHPLSEPRIHIISRDLNQQCFVSTYEDLADYAHLRSAFSIPKAALALVGFDPRFNGGRYASLKEQLNGRGFELIMNSPVPAGSGLGTSSVLAATVLAALAAYCHLDWSREEIGYRTLVLEQLLTSGGGWQDQYGGIIPAAKLLVTQPGTLQKPAITPLPSTLWTHPDLAPCHLLYFTGITRTARQILGQIVRRMFLREPLQQRHLFEMKQHAYVMADAIRLADVNPQQALEAYGACLRANWQQNQQLDAGCNPPAVQAICQQIDDLCLGYKLPGAGGGGFLYMVARDADAAALIRRRLTANPPSPTAGFYEFGLGRYGLHVVKVPASDSNSNTTHP